MTTPRKSKRPEQVTINYLFQEPEMTFEKAAAWLRLNGYAFRDSWLRTSIETWIPQKFKPLQNQMYNDPGNIESAELKRRTTTAKTFVFTCAQSNTAVHKPFLKALELFCKHRNAELHISRFTYNKSAHGERSVKPGTVDKDHSFWFDDAIQPYISDDSIQLAPDLVWCGELNILPTMKFPLTQFKTYTRQDSAILPHVKMSMESIPVMKGIPAKMLYTTGCVTKRNYIHKSAGQIADFHHVFGALLVELDEDGLWWVRQLNATNDGHFFELTQLFTPEYVLPSQQIAGITHGDIHWDKRDEDILNCVFGDNGVVNKLRPSEQHFHDIIDFMPRNHHNIRDPWHLHKTLVEGLSNVSGEFGGAGSFLSRMAYRPWCKTYIITSNHDQAIETWLKNPDVMRDPENVEWWHQMNAVCHKAIRYGKKPKPFAAAMWNALSKDAKDLTRIIHEDESHLCKGIEVGLHGHLGPNGARGSPKNLRTVGKANTAHTHTAGICDGVYTAGLYGKLDMDYNKGLSSWSHSFVITYNNGKRSICTIKNGRAYR